MDSEQNILEGSGFNFFVFKDGEFITPDGDNLDGITAQKTIEAIKEMGYNVVRRNINLNEMSEVSEAFITSTTKKIVPIFNINNTPVNDGKLGEKTTEVFKKFTQMYY